MTVDYNDSDHEYEWSEDGDPADLDPVYMIESGMVHTPKEDDDE